MPDISFNRILHVEFPNADLTGYTPVIEMGTASVSEIINSSTNIHYGDYNSNKFEVTMYNLPDVSGEKVEVYIEDSQEHTTTYVFVGYVDSCQLDSTGTWRHIVAYDEMYKKRTVSLKEWWNDYWIYHITQLSETSVPLKTLRDDVCEYVGFTLADRTVTYFNDTLQIAPVVMTLGSLQFGTFLTTICEMQQIFPNVTRDGKLEFIKCYDSPTTHTITSLYEKNNSTFENYTVPNITKLVILQNSNEIFSSQTSTTINTYTITDNLLLQSFSETDLQSFGNAYLTQLTNTGLLAYTPATIKMIVSDLDIKPGDICIADGRNIPVLTNELSGTLLVEQSIFATGDEFYPEAVETDLSEKVYISSWVEDTVEEAIEPLETEIQQTQTLASNALISANGKNTIYYGTTAPTGGTYKAGDTWYKEESNGSCTMYQYNETTQQWVQTQFGNEAIKDLAITNAKIADASIQSAKIAAIDAGKITTGTLNVSHIGGNIVNGNWNIDFDNGTFTIGDISASNIIAGTITGAVTATNLTMTGGSINIQTTSSTSNIITLNGGTSECFIAPYAMSIYTNPYTSDVTANAFSIKDANTSALPLVSISGDTDGGYMLIMNKARNNTFTYDASVPQLTITSTSTSRMPKIYLYDGTNSFTITAQQMSQFNTKLNGIATGATKNTITTTKATAALCTSKSIATSTWTSCGTMSLAAGTHIVKISATFAATSKGTCRIGLHTSVAEPPVAQSVIQPFFESAQRFECVCIVKPTATTTYYVVAHQNSGSAVNVTVWVDRILLA